MAATIYGSGTFGTADETSTTYSIYTESVSLSVNSDTATAPNHEGEVVGISIYNESAELTLSGVLSTADTTGGTIAQALQAAGYANSGIFSNDTSVTTFYTTSISLARTQAGFETGDVTAIGYGGLIATS